MQEYCNDKITRVLDKYPIVLNKARKRFVILFILGMIKLRSVQFCEVSQGLNDKVKAQSNEKRIQDFFRQVNLNYEQVALLLSMFIPRKKKVTLCIDRTEWDFGKCQVNILMIVVRCQDITIPLYWEMLDNKSGNSNTEDRIKLLKKCIKILGIKRIGLFLGDREFIGHKWLKFLKEQGILFCVQIPKHHKATVDNALHSEKYKIEQLLEHRTVVKVKDCMVDGVWGNVYAKRLKDDILYLFGTAHLNYLAELYRKRWRIEVFFQNIKKRGFNLENTHLRCFVKLKKLLALVCIAYALVVNMGLYHHKKVQAIPLKNHGYKANSFARKGIDLIRDGLRRIWRCNIDLYFQWVEKFFRWTILNPNKFTIP